MWIRRWACLAAECGAKSVDGFDIQEGMVELAKQATAQYSSVNICVGDVMDMPYNDNTFDVAISIFVTCNLPNEVVIKHFMELNRVLPLSRYYNYSLNYADMMFAYHYIH